VKSIAQSAVSNFGWFNVVTGLIAFAFVLWIIKSGSVVKYKPLLF
jgi:hypothetical protein